MPISARNAAKLDDAEIALKPHRNLERPQGRRRGALCSKVATARGHVSDEDVRAVKMAAMTMPR